MKQGVRVLLLVTMLISSFVVVQKRIRDIGTFNIGTLVHWYIGTLVPPGQDVNFASSASENIQLDASRFSLVPVNLADDAF